MPQRRTTKYPTTMVLTLRIPGHIVRRLDQVADAAGLNRQQVCAKTLEAVAMMSTHPQLDLFSCLEDRISEMVEEAIQHVVATRGLSSGPPTRGAS